MTNDFFKSLTGSRRFITALAVLGFLFVAVVIFSAGVAVGFHKAAFDRDWRDNYERNFGVFPGSPFARRLPNPHGGFGTIASVTLPSFTIVGPREDEKLVTITPTTLIRRGDANATSTDLSVGETAIVLGRPNATGGIDAVFIRLSPATTTSTR